MNNRSMILEGLANKASYKRSEYSWGVLRVINVGTSFSVIMHPEHWDVVKKAISSEKADSFKDEQGYVWNVSKDGDNVTFSTKGNKVTVPLQDLIGKLD